jgi:membrane protein
VGLDLESGRRRWRRGRVGSVLTSPIQNPIERLGHFFSETIWEDDPRHGWFKRLVYERLRVITLVYWNYFAHGLSRHAAALTYSSLLALVPTLAVAFSLFQVFGGLEDVRATLEAKLFEYLAPSPEIREQIQGLIATFVENVTRGKQANAFLGTVILFFTVVNTLSWIESSFNAIFGVRRSRGLFQRFTVYWAVATLGPVLLGGSLAISATFFSSQVVSEIQRRLAIVEIGYRLAPMILTCAAFTFLYRFLPNTKVRMRPAIAGGVLAGLMFEGAKLLFTRAAVSLLGSYQRIYGPIALLFVFFFWIWVSWMILLIGLELVVAAQSAGTHRREELASQVSQKVREMLALRVITEVAEKFYYGADPPTTERLALALEVPLRLVNDVAGVLEARGIIREIEEHTEEHGYVPGKHLANLTVYDVISAMREDGATGFTPRADEESRYLSRLVKEAEAANRRVFGGETLEKVIERLVEWREARRKEREAAGGQEGEKPAPGSASDGIPAAKAPGGSGGYPAAKPPANGDARAEPAPPVEPAPAPIERPPLP